MMGLFRKDLGSSTLFGGEPIDLSQRDNFFYTFCYIYMHTFREFFPFVLTFSFHILYFILVSLFLVQLIFYFLSLELWPFGFGLFCQYLALFFLRYHVKSPFLIFALFHRKKKVTFLKKAKSSILP